jgi:hypothetical protein
VAARLTMQADAPGPAANIEHAPAHRAHARFSTAGQRRYGAK